jgi:hypothetical protein
MKNNANIRFFQVFDLLRASSIAIGIAASDDRSTTKHTLRVIGPAPLPPHSFSFSLTLLLKPTAFLPLLL